MNGPVRVTVNEATKLAVANGSQVVIEEITPHPSNHRGWQQVHNQEGIVMLDRPSIIVYVERVDEYNNYNTNENYHPQNKKG
jgi:hypothetical protein